MPTLKILCTSKATHPQAHLSISHIGGVNSNKRPWTLTVEDAIRTLELKQYRYCVMLDGRRTEVYVAQTPSGEKYLKCGADFRDGDTLTSLPDCP